MGHLNHELANLRQLLNAQGVSTDPKMVISERKMILKYIPKLTHILKDAKYGEPGKCCLAQALLFGDLGFTFKQHPKMPTVRW